MEEKKVYIVGLLMNPDMDDDAEMHDEDFSNYAYTDYESAKEAFAQATKAMVGDAIPLDDLLKHLRPLTTGGYEAVRFQDGYKAVRFQEFDHMPDMDIQEGPIDLDYFREEETVDDDGEESEEGGEWDGRTQ